MRKIVLTIMIVLSLLSSTLVSCNREDSNNIADVVVNDPNGIKTERVLNWNLGNTIKTLDPGLNAASNSGDVINNTFEGLMREVNGKPVYAVADSHTVSEDGLIYSFHIRNGVKWSNGQDVTAYDFEYAWNRNTDPETASDYAWIFDEFNYESCRAIDESTFEVTLNEPADYFLGLTSFFTLMPLNKDAVDSKENGTWASTPETVVCNGPFILSEYISGDRVVLIKNEMYWNKDEVHIDKIIARMIGDSSAAFAEYSSGGLDFNTFVPPSEIQRLLVEDPSFRVEPRPGTYMLSLNVNAVPELKDVRVRQALSLVIDRVAITDMLNSGNIPAVSFIPPGIKDENGEEFVDKASEYGVKIHDVAGNIKKAKQLLVEAGYPNGEGLPTLEYITNNGEDHILIAQHIQDTLNVHLGINFEISSMEWAVFLEQKKAQNYQLSRGSWIGDYVDPLTFIGLYTSDSLINSAQWSNAEFDKLIADSGYKRGQERYDLLAAAEKLVVEDAYYIPIYNYVTTIHQKPYLKGVERGVLGELYFGRAYFDD